jgi:tetratricopeptide (TPR) repeat protein
MDVGAALGGRPGESMSAFLFEQPNGLPLNNQVVVFTGKLSLLGRREARALVERLGGTTADEVNVRTTMLVVGGEGFPTTATRNETDAGAAPSHKLRKAQELNASGAAAIMIIPEADFCTTVGLPSPEALRKQYYPMRDLLARYTKLREDHLRYLQKWGLIRPVLRTNADVYFAFSDLALLKQLNADLEQGTPFRRLLRALAPSGREGQLAFDFRIDAPPARILQLRRPLSGGPSVGAGRSAGPGAVTSGRSHTHGTSVEASARAEEYFLTASLLDDGDEAKQEQAAAAYRKALEADPYLAAALINLANIHYARNELAEAQALYERAIGLEPDFFEAHFNLGNIYHDLGRLDEAIACYRTALTLSPTYADAHFYLAVACEKQGLSQEARPHWKAYQNLAPNGEWVALAREFSD